MAHWNELSIKQIEKWVGPDCNVEYVGYLTSGPSTREINDNNDNRLDLIIGYNNTRNLYAAWNPYLHFFRSGLYHVSVDKTKLYKPFEKYSVSYSELKDKKGSYEKKLLIKPDFLETFCKNWRAFLKPVDTEKGRKKVLWADRFQPEPILWEEYCNTQKEIVIRDKNAITRAQRDYSFRRRIFFKYDTKF